MNPTHSPLSETARIILNHALEAHPAPFDSLRPTAFFFHDCGGTSIAMDGDDPYSSLLRIGQEIFPLTALGIGLIYCGWSAPSSDVSPSESPDRQRVACVFLIGRTFERECVMKIEGTIGDPTVMGAGDGPLADAMEEALTRSFWNRLLEFD